MTTTTPAAVPAITLDPRFRAGKTLVQTGRAGEGAIDIFETLVQEARREFGESSIEAAACYYEYGNSLFRAAARDEEEEENDNEEERDDDSKPKAEDTSTEDDKNPSQQSASEAGDDDDDDGDADDEAAGETEGDIDDVSLALEMMETAWSILDKYVNESDGTTNYTEWASDQLPRILLGIGDVLSTLNRHADAADAYSRALPHREAALQQLNNTHLTLDHLKRRRQLVEANVLVAEALLACPKEEDVVTTETNDLLVKAAERVEYARGYYDKARDELQETVFLMGKIAVSGQDLGTEKEDVCFISTMLMGVGTTLAELDEEAAVQHTNGEDLKPPAKKQKT